MDYQALTTELLQQMHKLRKFKPQMKISESLRGVMFILHYIAHNGYEVLPGEISSEMDVSSARVAAALNTLENKGLIAREIDKSDRRRILVSLTPEGKRITEQHERELINDVSEILSRLGEHDALEFVRILGRMADISMKYMEPR